MNIYKNFSEEELVDAYIQWIDNSGKIGKELEEVLIERGNIDIIKAKANHKKLIIKEKGRISFEINKMVLQNKSMEEIDEKISSELLEKDELSYFILEKYIVFEHNKKDSEVDKDTIYKSIIGLAVASIAGFLFLLLILFIIKGFIFYLLVPTYIVCYFIIKMITGKSRSNLAVFISTFLATVFSALLVFLVFKSSIN
ncbi:hypothetical protein [Epilithonimonas zeae]|uniref:hypothetical protein n=1 Tax=Epilithonimonas zeae TaxID=1416779 RepID=UPI00200E8B4D|nr:hypothetical protein [Epilithonimonas zeae]UQB68442.1 hypothetical protein KI430_15670 [Epilithonimonas zeae]